MSEVSNKKLSINENYFTVCLDDFEQINREDIPISEYSETYFIGVIEKFLSSLYSENEVSVDSIGQIMSYINNDYLVSKSSKNSLSANVNFSKLFIDIILSERKTIYIYFKNFNNLKHFSNLLNTITINIDDVNCENYDLNFAIIFIAGRTFFKKPDNVLNKTEVDKKENSSNDEDESNEVTLRAESEVKIKVLQESIKLNYSEVDKIYLSAMLSLNKLYSSKTFWTDLIELKIGRKVDEAMRKLSSKKKNSDNLATQSGGLSSVSASSMNSLNTTTLNNYSTNTNITTTNNMYSNYSTNVSSSHHSSLIGSVGSKLKGFFKAKPSIKNRESHLIQSQFNQTNLTRELIKEKETTTLDLVRYLEASVVLKEFIVHFANFNLDITDGMNIIVETASNYNFPKERISLYVTLLNSHAFTVKNRLPKSVNKKTSMENSLLESKESIYSLTSYEKKIEYVFYSSKFLQKEDLLNVLFLNKEASSLLINRVLGFYLGRLEPNDTEKRVIIWKALLKTVRKLIIYLLV